MQIHWDYLGRTDYNTCFDLQNRIRESILQNDGPDRLLLTEHNRVFTMGLREKGSNLLLSRQALARKGFEVAKTNRGGMVTYHGPGQLVIYPILNLKRHKLRLKDYVKRLEMSVVDLLSAFELKASRKDGYPGVWIDEKKIGSLGIHVRKMVTIHGFALNVSTHLEDFQHINPCGFQQLEITSMHREGIKERSLEKISEKLVSSFEKVFNVECERVDLRSLLAKEG